MASPAALHEPELSPAARRVLAALLFSLGLHAAIIGLVRLAPAPAVTAVPGVLQVQLQEQQAQPPVPPLKPATGAVAVMAATTPEVLPFKMPPPTLQAPVPPPVRAPAVVAPPAPVAQQSVQPPAPASKSSLPSVNVPLLVDNTYYTAKEVDVHPRALQPVAPIYPDAAADRQIQGWVLLKIRLDDTGRVEEVKVEDASPQGVFDQAALDAFTKAKFAPAQKAGHAVKALVEIKVWFNLN